MYIRDFWRNMFLEQKIKKFVEEVFSNSTIYFFTFWDRRKRGIFSTLNTEIPPQNYEFFFNNQIGENMDEFLALCCFK